MHVQEGKERWGAEAQSQDGEKGQSCGGDLSGGPPTSEGGRSSETLRGLDAQQGSVLLLILYSCTVRSVCTRYIYTVMAWALDVQGRYVQSPYEDCVYKVYTVIQWGLDVQGRYVQSPYEDCVYKVYTVIQWGLDVQGRYVQWFCEDCIVNDTTCMIVWTMYIQWYNDWMYTVSMYSDPVTRPQTPSTCLQHPILQPLP